MLEMLDFDYSKYPAILKWFAEMRKIEGVNKANENFEKSKGFIRQLMAQNPKL
jgi:hypothetical protein